MADLSELRRAARAILDAAITAGDAGRLTRRTLTLEGSNLSVGHWSLDLDGVRRVVVVGAGKASGAMAAAVEGILGERIAEGLVVVKESHGSAPERVRVVEAGHPLPDERGQAAAGEILHLVRGAGPDDLVLCLISGGGSALLPSPVEGVSLAEKQAVTRLMLEAGADITELNTVRKHLSALKGGQLARAAFPARVLALVLSDVIGDPLDVIAAGPTEPDPSTFTDALRVVDTYGLRWRVPSSARQYLEAGVRGEVPETPKPGNALFSAVTSVVIGNNGLVVEAAVEEAARLGYTPLVLTRSLQGEAREVARVFGAILCEAARSWQPLAPPGCLIAGGETTVTVRGSGKGGRCQEFCLALARELVGIGAVVVLAAGTDGTDGPTDAAGAVVDETTLERARTRGLDARAALTANDSYAFFSALGDLVITGPTATNLMDLYIGVLGPTATESA